jgi:sec-independent protein translocase protein TatA
VIRAPRTGVKLFTMPNIGAPDIIIVLIIVLVVFGPKRLPELGKSMGEGIRGFKGAMGGDDDEDSVEKKQAELQAANQQPAAAPVAAAGEPVAQQPAPPAAAPVEQGEVVTENKG